MTFEPENFIGANNERKFRVGRFKHYLADFAPGRA